MATDALIDNGELDAPVLEAMFKSFGANTYDDSIPTDVVAGVLFLDGHFGLNQPDDRLVLDPSSARWLLDMGSMNDASARLQELLEEIDMYDEPEPDDDTYKALEQELALILEGNWTTITFVDYENFRLHPLVQGKKLIFRAMTAAEARAAKEAGYTCATVREDGSLIRIPGEERLPHFNGDMSEW